MFLTKSDDKVASLFAAAQKRVLRCEDDTAVYAALRDTKPDRIIIDHLDVDPVLARKISLELGTKLIILTNLSEANRYADVTVMAGMGSELKNIRKGGNDGQVQLWGPKYWLIRPEFFSYEKEAASEIQQVLLIFGGADPANLTAKVLAELLKIDRKFHVTAVLGASYTGFSELAPVLIKAEGRATIIQGSNSIAELMHRSDLVLASPGLSFFEALVVGTPVICFHQNRFQQDAWRGVLRTYGAEEVSMIDQLIESKSFVYPHDPLIQAMRVGEGVDELLEEILA